MAEKNKRKKADKKAGHPTIYAGIKMERLDLRLPPAYAAYLKKLGYGSFGAGVRALTEHAMKTGIKTL